MGWSLRRGVRTDGRQRKVADCAARGVGQVDTLARMMRRERERKRKLWRIGYDDWLSGSGGGVVEDETVSRPKITGSRDLWKYLDG